MKKIKILYWFLVSLLVLFTIGFFTNFYVFKDFKGQLFLDFLITSGFSMLIILGLFFIQRGLFAILKKGFFSTKVGKYFKISGMCFLFCGFGSTVFNILILNREGDSNSQFFYTNLSTYFLLIMIGFGLFVISEFVENGNILKLENELTI